MLEALADAPGWVLALLLMASYFAGVGTKDYLLWAVETARVVYARRYDRKPR